MLHPLLLLCLPLLQLLSLLLVPLLSLLLPGVVGIALHQLLVIFLLLLLKFLASLILLLLKFLILLLISLVHLRIACIRRTGTFHRRQFVGVIERGRTISGRRWISTSGSRLIPVFRSRSISTTIGRRIVRRPGFTSRNCIAT